jgi:hypothetical protein
MELRLVASTCVLLLIFSVSTTFASEVDAYTEVLSRYVKDGLVDYKALCKDARLQQYVDSLAKTDPEKLESRDAKLAFWINAYNAYTLKVICDHYPVSSINDLHFGGLFIGQALGKTVWHKKFVRINNQDLSLNQIEHEIIRPKFKEPRIHFALVCAAMSCPPLRSEAYQGANLDSQLNEQGRVFLNNPLHNRFDLKKEQARISKIFDWYGKDFGKNDTEVLLYISRYLPAETANAIKANPERWDVEYIHYNWSLNDRDRVGTDRQKSKRGAWQVIKDWFFVLGERYNVNPILFGSIYVGAIPFFTLSIAWLVRNYRQRKSIVLPALCASFCFVSAYLYLIIAGQNVPFWVYGLVLAMIVAGAISTIRKVREKIQNTPQAEAK